MSWPRGSLFAALLTLSIPQAYADAVIVNTTTDDNASNSLCSLREAVEYFNQGKPDAGWQGCKRDGEASEVDSVSIPADKNPYLIENSAIDVRVALSISGAGIKGDTLTHIKVNGAHRAFVIDSSPTYLPPACAASASCQSANSPQLDPASDTGTSATDWLTPDSSPVFNGTAPAPSVTGYTVKVILYSQIHGATEPTVVGSGLADVSTNVWKISPSSALDIGEHSITYTTQQLDANGEAVGSESAHSDKTTLRIYTEPSVLAVSLSSLELEGCGAADCADDVDVSVSYVYPGIRGLEFTRNLTGTVGKGGIIYSTESLGLATVVVHGGAAANTGGAIHAAGSGVRVSLQSSTLRDNESVKGGAIYAGTGTSITVESSTLRENTALNGAALYLENNGLALATSLVTENVVSTGGSAVIEVASTTAATTGGNSSIENTTVTGNTGLAFSLRTGRINTSTIVLNSGGGLDFNATNVGVHNTILAGNTGNDCSNLPGTTNVTFSLVTTSGGCPATGTGMQVISNAAGTDQQLMATLDAGGFCSSEFGLLCPLSAGDEQENFLPYHLPRLLSSYTALSQSFIINKGFSSTSGVSCPAADQRGKTRSNCDIGAIEVQALAGTVRSGGAVSYYLTYIGSLRQNLGDEELLDPSQCPGTAPANAVPGSYNPNAPGCPWLETSPPRGAVVFNDDATYSYTPYSPFHGFDSFSFRVTTTLSRLNIENIHKSRPVLAKVIVEPTRGISESSLGAFGAGPLVLLVLLGWRRSRRGQ